MHNVVVAQDFARRRQSAHLTIRDRKLLEASNAARRTVAAPMERQRRREANRNFVSGFVLGCVLATVLFALSLWWVPV